MIADVSDKGIAAALFMAFARTVIHAIAQIILNPAIASNGKISSEPRQRHQCCITTFYGVLNPAGGELCYVNAGHDPPITSWSMVRCGAGPDRRHGAGRHG